MILPLRAMKFISGDMNLGDTLPTLRGVGVTQTKHCALFGDMLAYYVGLI